MATVKIDISHMISPIGLLECKNALSELQAGDVLEVSVQDPEVVQHIKRIIKPSADRVIKTDSEDGYYRLSIQKRNATRSWQTASGGLTT